MKDPQWSTGKNWMSLGVPVTSIKWHSGQLERIQSHWWLLWSCDGFTVVYCGILNTIGDYCNTTHRAQVTTGTTQNTVDYCRPKKASQWYTAKNWMSLGTTVETRGIIVVNCMEWNAIGHYWRPMKDPHWSTGGKSMPLVTTVYPSRCTVDYFGDKVDSKWSTAENW